MDCNQIYDLLELLPPDISLGGELVDARWVEPNADGLSGSDLLNLAVAEPQRYAYAYADLQFGWNWLKLLIRNELEFTEAMRHASDPALQRAYSHIMRKHYDPYVMEALMISQCKERQNTRMILNALFLAKDYTLEAVCQSTGLDPITIAVYEKLFFNAVDRRQESLWLGSVVYPNTMLVEMFENYMSPESSDFAKILMRAGHKNGMRDVLYFAGHSNGAGLLADAQAKDTPERFESLVMANGYLMARNGWLGQKSASGFTNAKNMITAAKVGGQSSSAGNNSPFEGLGTVLSNQLISAKRGETKAMLSQRNTRAITK
jgi:hypothetical protein